MDFSNLVFWRAKELNKHLFMYCPSLDKGLENFGQKREVYKEFKLLEKFAFVDYLGWLAYTHSSNTHIIKMFNKMGAKPIFVNPFSSNIWFRKGVSDV